MHNYYINEQCQIYRYLQIHIMLNDTEKEAFLTELDNCKLISVKDNGDMIEAIYSNGLKLNLAIAAFQNRNKQGLESLQSKIKEFKEREQINKYQSTYAKKPKINRELSKKLGTLTVTSSLTLAAVLFATFPKTQANAQKDSPSVTPTEEFGDVKTLADLEREINRLAPDITLASPKEITQPSKEAPEATSTLTFDIPLRERTEADFQKYDETVFYFGDTIKYYCERYGLPFKETCAQLTQERPDIQNGTVENICQLSNLVGETVTATVYNEFGPTGEVDEFVITDDMVNSIDDNIKAGLAYLQVCVNKNNSYLTGLYGYNQGPSSLKFACEYYGLNLEDYQGEENALKAHDLIKEYYQDRKDGKWGDPEYFENIFSYIRPEDRSSFTCFANGEKKVIAINDTLEYNNSQTRG